MTNKQLCFFLGQSPAFCNGTQPVGTSLGYTSPDGLFNAYWAIDETKGVITFSVKAQSDGWTSLGINDANDMVGADVIMVYIVNGVLQYYDGMATAHSLPAPDVQMGGTNDVQDFSGSVSVESGITFISFQYTRKLVTGDSKDVALDRSKTSQYILYAIGSMSGSSIIEHASKDIAVMDFFAGITGAALVTPAQFTHGSLMMVGWILILTSGALIGHKYREFSDKWFVAHVTLQLVGSLIVLIAFIIIFVDRGGFVFSAHAVIGIIIFCLVLCQIILGIVSNRVPAVRERVHFVHRWGGRSTIVLAFVNMMLGYSNFTDSGAAVYVICVVWFAIFVGAFFAPLSSRYEEFDMDLDEKKPKLKYLTPASKALFFGYLSVAVIVVAVLIALVVVPKKVVPVSVTEVDLSADSALIAFSNFSIPGQTTTYVCLTLKFVGNSRDAIRISPIVDNAQVVHHMVLFNTPQLNDENVPVWDCTNMPSGTPVFLWAVGGVDMVMPNDVGLRFGSDGVQYAVLQMHYDLSWAPDPTQAHQFDSSGIKLYFADKLQQEQMDVLIFGVSFSLIQIPPGKSEYTLSNTCGSAATAGLPQDLNVFAAGLHMHKRGKSINFEQFRNGQSLGYIASLPEWDFNNQQWISVNTTVQPRDSLVTTCTWDTSQDTSIILGGEDTSKEMCYAFMFYYPKITELNGACET